MARAREPQGWQYRNCAVLFLVLAAGRCAAVARGDLMLHRVVCAELAGSGLHYQDGVQGAQGTADR